MSVTAERPEHERLHRQYLRGIHDRESFDRAVRQRVADGRLTEDQAGWLDHQADIWDGKFGARPDPDCTDCRGTGKSVTVYAPDDVDVSPCDCRHPDDLESPAYPDGPPATEAEYADAVARGLMGDPAGVYGDDVPF